MSDSSPFVPGARVAVQTERGYYSPIGYREDFVARLHKTGRFTLRSDPAQQWSPSRPFSGCRYWSATQTGDRGWSYRGALRIWDEDADSDIKAEIANRARYDKFSKLQESLRNQKFSELVTDDVLDNLEMVVLAVKPIPREKL